MWEGRGSKCMVVYITHNGCIFSCSVSYPSLLWGGLCDDSIAINSYATDVFKLNDIISYYIIDQITGENIGRNATGYWSRLVQPCVDTGTRWAAVFGNHGEIRRTVKCQSHSYLYMYMYIGSLGIFNIALEMLKTRC